MGQLQVRMTEDLALKGLSPHTCQGYVAAARAFARHYMRSPADMGEAEVRQYLLHLSNVRKASPSLRKLAVAGIKFLYCAKFAPRASCRGADCDHRGRGQRWAGRVDARSSWLHASARHSTRGGGSWQAGNRVDWLRRRGFSRQPAIIGVPNSPSNSPPSLVPDACPSQQGFTYERRHPELHPLHKAVRIGWPLLQQEIAEHTAAALPKFVVKGFEAYLTCGQLAAGFCRVKCRTCRQEEVVAWSCKQRGVCASCDGKVMAAYYTSFLWLCMLVNVALNFAPL